jgi:hypothetical protein
LLSIGSTTLLPERILAVLQEAGTPPSAGQLHKAVSQGKPLAVPRPVLFRVLLELSACGRAIRSGQPSEYLYRLTS